MLVPDPLNRNASGVPTPKIDITLPGVCEAVFVFSSIIAPPVFVWLAATTNTARLPGVNAAVGEKAGSLKTTGADL